MKTFLTLTLATLVALASACASSYTITTRDIREAMGNVVHGRRKVSVRGATLTIVSNAPIPVRVYFRNEPVLLPPGGTVSLEYPNAGMMGDGAYIRVPVVVVPAEGAKVGRIVGTSREWYVYGSLYTNSNQSWILECPPGLNYLTLR